MKILAVDTAEQTCSVALAEPDRVWVELTTAVAGTHARHLMPMVQTALGMAGIELSSLDGFAVTSGPGSFTGIRIGMSCVQALAEATGKPVVGVSPLEGLARQGAVPEFLVCPMMDARRREVYWALYRSDGSRMRLIRGPGVDAADKVLSEVDRPCVFVGSGALAYRSAIGSGHHTPPVVFAPDDQHFVRAASVARNAFDIFNSNQHLPPLAPVYLRASDAERNRALNTGSH